ncbi:MAG: DUF3087 domain-containing protein [Thalassotalea sp.]
MKLIEIDKASYRHRLNRVIIGFVSIFTVLALAFGALLIAVFSEPDADNFKLNLAGVVIALLVCGGALNSLKNKAYFHEIVYVWRLKQLQNKIFRKLKKIKSAGQDNNPQALAILYFYYQSLQQVYLLDDNTLTISKVKNDLNALERQIESLALDTSQLQFEPRLLAEF